MKALRVDTGAHAFPGRLPGHGRSGKPATLVPVQTVDIRSGTEYSSFATNQVETYEQERCARMRSRRWASISVLILMALTLILVTATPLLADETFGVESPGSNDYPSGTAGRTTQGSLHASFEGWLEASRIAIPAGGCFVTHVNVALETGGGSIRYAI